MHVCVLVVCLILNMCVTTVLLKCLKLGCVLDLKMCVLGSFIGATLCSRGIALHGAHSAKRKFDENVHK